MPGTPCFADTFFFLALLNRRDAAHHQLALEANRVDRPVVTSAWVLLELADHLCDVHNRHLVREVRDALAQDPRYEIVAAHQALLDRAIQLYDRRADKDWSLTDCTSFVIMGDRGVAEALTADHHFEQAGFVALLKAVT
jgi:predicted nucleic acid-binding protein